MAILPAILLAATFTVGNATRDAVEATWSQLAPRVTAPQTVRLGAEETFDTGLPVSKDHIYRVVFHRGGTRSARSAIGVNVESATLFKSGHITFRPPFDQRIWPDVNDADGINRDKRPSTLYCIPVDARMWNGQRVIVLADGRFMELGSDAGAGGEGRRCFCGRAVATDPKSEMERFDAGSLCGTR
jgi:hypothetical protein